MVLFTNAKQRGNEPVGCAVSQLHANTQQSGKAFILPSYYILPGEKVRSHIVIGLELFILGNSHDFAICRVFFVCFFFDIEK